MAGITKRNLDREIAEYEDGKLDRSTARDLAALYTIRNNLFPEKPEMGIPVTASFAGPETVGEYGDTPFFLAIAGKDPETAWKVMGQLMDTLSLVSVPLYNQVLRQLAED